MKQLVFKYISTSASGVVVEEYFGGTTLYVKIERYEKPRAMVSSLIGNAIREWLHELSEKRLLIQIDESDFLHAFIEARSIIDASILKG